MTYPHPLPGYAIAGDAASILMLMFGPKQHDSHIKRRRRYLRDKRLADNMAIIDDNLRLGRPKWDGVK